MSIIRSILTAGEHFLQFSEFARDPVGPIARLFVLLLNFGQQDDRADGLTDLFQRALEVLVRLVAPVFGIRFGRCVRIRQAVAAAGMPIEGYSFIETGFEKRSGLCTVVQKPANEMFITPFLHERNIGRTVTEMWITR